MTWPITQLTTPGAAIEPMQQLTILRKQQRKRWLEQSLPDPAAVAGNLACNVTSFLIESDIIDFY